MNKQTTSKPEGNKAATKPDNIIIKGRGKRGKDKQPRKKRIDNNPSLAIPSGEKKNIMHHNFQLYKMPKIDCNDISQLTERIDLYFSLCSQNDIFPSVSGFAFSLGIDRQLLWYWLNNPGNCAIKNSECFDIIKKVYRLINTQYEDMMNTGKINPVSGIFLMKNNFGYKDQTDHTITAKQEQTETEENLLDRAGLLTD